MSRHDTTPTDDERAWARDLLHRDADTCPAEAVRLVRMTRALGVAEVALTAAIADNETDARTIARALAVTDALREKR